MRRAAPQRCLATEVMEGVCGGTLLIPGIGCQMGRRALSVGCQGAWRMDGLWKARVCPGRAGPAVSSPEVRVGKEAVSGPVNQRLEKGRE